MIKLVDQFGTRYFASHWAGEVEAFLKTVKEVDIADARICRDVMKYVQSAASDGVYVCDTLDSERNELFAENRRRKSISLEGGVRQPLPLPTASGNILPTIKSLNPDIIYTIPDGGRVLDRAFTVLVQAARPEIQIDLGINTESIFAFVHTHLFPNSHRWDEFYVLVGSTFVVRRAPPEGYADFISENRVIPTVFGREKLLNAPEWERCISCAVAAIEAGLKPKYKKIRDYL